MHKRNFEVAAIAIAMFGMFLYGRASASQEPKEQTPNGIFFYDPHVLTPTLIKLGDQLIAECSSIDENGLARGCNLAPGHTLDELISTIKGEDIKKMKYLQTNWDECRAHPPAPSCYPGYVSKTSSK